ncbi:L-ascorbate oxidase [Crassisporium funariophilum]|nr:L-ascorbate oxidase [Crassisporium funariophilum]
MHGQQRTYLALSLLSLFTPLTSAAAAYKWPSPQYDALEGLLYEGRRGDGSSLASLVHPCRKRSGTLASVAAEWLRFAFHDMATHNSDDGTGGLDGSIVYELNRPENFGLGFNQTLSDFEVYPNKLISRADVITIGAIFAVATCGGPIIPFRGNRTDTYTPGGTGTPEPQHDLATLTDSFRKQGFSQTEMIKLVACGHSFGGVRSSDFPELVPPNPNSVMPVIVDFDTTAQFDNGVVTEYLDGTTKNVLVVSPNKTMVADLRVFESDGNSTMRSLADKNVYASECQTMLTRMLDTVPKDVTLTDEITLLPAKVNGGQLSFEKNQLVFKASLRLTQPTNTTANPKRVVTMFWCDKYGPNAACSGKTNTALPISTVADDPNISPVTLNLGFSFLNYNFVLPIDSARSIASFYFESDEKDGSKATRWDNGGAGYGVEQDKVMLVPMMSKVAVVSNGTYTKTYTNRFGESFTRLYSLVVAVRDDAKPTRVYLDATDIAIRDFPFSIHTPVELTLNSTSYPPMQGYSFYTGVAESVGLQMTVDVHAVGAAGTSTQENAQTLVLDNMPYVAPGAVGSVDGKTGGARALGLGGALGVVGVGMVLGGWTLLDWVV